MGEGLQHQDGHSLVMASTVPFCEAYDPAFSYEVAAIIKHGLRRMYGPAPGGRLLLPDDLQRELRDAGDAGSPGHRGGDRPRPLLVGAGRREGEEGDRAVLRFGLRRPRSRRPPISPSTTTSASNCGRRPRTRSCARRRSRSSGGTACTPASRPAPRSSSTLLHEAPGPIVAVTRLHADRARADRPLPAGPQLHRARHRRHGPQRHPRGAASPLRGRRRPRRGRRALGARRRGRGRSPRWSPTRSPATASTPMPPAPSTPDLPSPAITALRDGGDVRRRRRRLSLAVLAARPADAVVRQRRLQRARTSGSRSMSGRAGRVPLWNDPIFGGVSHLGNTQTGALYPARFLVARPQRRPGIDLLVAAAPRAADGRRCDGSCSAWGCWRLRDSSPPSVSAPAGRSLVKTIQFEQFLVLAWAPLLLITAHAVVTSSRPWRAAAAFGATADGGRSPVTRRSRTCSAVCSRPGRSDGWRRPEAWRRLIPLAAAGAPVGRLTVRAAALRHRCTPRAVSAIGRYRRLSDLLASRPSRDAPTICGACCSAPCATSTRRRSPEASSRSGSSVSGRPRARRSSGRSPCGGTDRRAADAASRSPSPRRSRPSSPSDHARSCTAAPGT